MTRFALSLILMAWIPAFFLQSDPAGSTVSISETMYAGIAHFKIETERATYYYDKAGGGFSRIIDADGNDWIDFQPVDEATYPASAANAYRGLPNFVHGGDDSGTGHPGFSNCMTEQIDPTTLRTTTLNERWQWTVQFTKTHASITINRTDTTRNYWFLFEGPIAGTYNPERQFWGTDTEGRRTETPDHINGTPATGSWQWAYFGDSGIDRVLFVAQHEADDRTDTFSYLGHTRDGLGADDGMVVFGFGRDGIEPQLTGTNTFLLGFIETPTDHEAVASYIDTLLRPSTREINMIGTFKHLTKDAEWHEVAVIPVSFNTYHPQGFARVNDVLFVSSVETVERPDRYETPQNGWDRSPGRGIGHLFKMSMEGELIAHTTLGEGTMYHPGGIDYDGQYIWVPVAEYRPNSQSIFYRVNPETMEATEVFRYPDHIGGIVHNTDDGTLFGISWGSRRFYTWPLNDDLEVTNADRPPDELQVPNPSHYIDYQDCRYVGAGYALCSGLNSYQSPTQTASLSLGGIDLIDVRRALPIHQVPLPLWTGNNRSMTQNPVELELIDLGLRAYFMPEDNESRLFIYEVRIQP